MSDRLSPLRRSLQIANTLWLPAMVLYFFEHVAFIGSLGVPPFLSKFIDPAIGLVAKIVFNVWLWGLIIETVSGESAIVHYKQFRLNLKQGWWISCAVILVPWIIHFLIFMALGREVISLPFLKAVLSVFLIYWAVREFFRMKYSSLVAANSKEVYVSWALLGYGVVFFLFSTGILLIDAAAEKWPLVQRGVELIGMQIGFATFAVFAYVFIDAHPEIRNKFKSSKTFVLVNPLAGSIRTEAFSSVIVRRYPSFFAVLQALTPPEFRVIEYNRVFWRDHFYRGDALVAITCVTTNCAAAYNIAREFRRRGSKVVMGGPHISFFPEEALEFCDSVVIGAAESVWPEVVQDYAGGRLKRIYEGQCSEKESAQVQQFLLQSPVEVTRDCMQITPGCKFNCYFCAATALTGKVRLKKKIDDVIALVRKVSVEKKPIVFLDNNIYEDPKYAKDLFRAMIPFKQPWGASASIDIAQDDEAVRLLKESRCIQILIGYEIDSGSSTLKKEGKFALARDYLKLTKKLKKVGIGIQAQFIFGFPGDSLKSLVRLWWFCFKLSPTYNMVSFLTPLPGSRYFEDCVREGRIINLNWRCYDIMRQVVEQPTLHRSWIWQNCYTLISIFIFFTTSFVGRLLFVIAVILEVIYFHIA